ncbi:MAG: molybdopterin-guanine dinucleotide biosynthesis protein B [Coriobacteriia bacterium]|nr:molybdopterin-guanine dinucleotide biosynthesis protein B [Coriobacteriia bacterium]
MTDFRIPVVSVVGKGKSGRTTLLEGVITTLTGRGYRVATAKHHFHETDIDTPGKDSWRHWNAGAVVTMVSAPDRLGVFRRVEQERTLVELAGEAGDVDIMLTEGFRRTSPVLVEVVREERSTEPICAPEELFALVTDVEELRGLPVPTFALDDAAGLATLIEERFLGEARGGDA